MQRPVPVEIVAALVRVAESWRYDVEDLIAARRDALTAANQYAAEVLALGSDSVFDIQASVAEEQLDLSVTRVASFSRVPLSLTHDFYSWYVRVRGRWERVEDILRTEGRSLVIAYRHALRSIGHLRHHVICLSDSLIL